MKGLYKKWIDMTCPDCNASLTDDGHCIDNCLAYQVKVLERKNDKLEDANCLLRGYNKQYDEGNEMLVEKVRKLEKEMGFWKGKSLILLQNKKTVDTDKKWDIWNRDCDDYVKGE